MSSALSSDDVELLLRAAFLIGAVTDGLAIVPMLSPRAASALFGGDPGRSGREYRYAMGIGASLMAGWTVLLLWGAASPFERRDLLVLTVFPVVAGIVAASVVAARWGVVKPARMVPLWIHLGLVCALYLVAYGLSAPFAP